jgi:hypothetical protein
MALKKKTGRRQRLHVLGTAVDFVDLPTHTALEVVMMGLRSRLIAWRLTGQLNLDEPAFCDESFEGAIDRRNAQTRGVHLCDLEHLLRTQRTTSFFDNAPDSPALASITFHSEMVHGIGEQLQYQCRVDKRELRP